MKKYKFEEQRSEYKSPLEEGIGEGKEEKIIDLLKNREAGNVDGIKITADEIDIYFHDKVPNEKKIDYRGIAKYIIHANN